jgi:hypothetical protein
MRTACSAIMLIVFEILYAPSGHAHAQELSRKTLETMRSHATGLRAVSGSESGSGQQLKLVATPVLRYSDPGGITTDASIWAWGDVGRPSILAGIFFLTQEGRETKWSCELLSLADGRVAVTSKAGWEWAPAKGGLKWFSLGAADPDLSARQRLRQMKDIAERYEVRSFEGSVTSQLRLMVQPIVRYSDAANGLVDGSIFSYAAGTNPEALLLVECRDSAGAQTWQAAFARFGAAKCEAKEGVTPIWDCPAIQQWKAKEPYYSRYGLVEEVFGAASD